MRTQVGLFLGYTSTELGEFREAAEPLTQAEGILR